MRKCRRYCRNGMQVEEGGKEKSGGSSTRLTRLGVGLAGILGLVLAITVSIQVMLDERFNDFMDGVFQSSPLILFVLVAVLMCGAVSVAAFAAAVIAVSILLTFCSFVANAVGFCKNEQGTDSPINYSASEATNDRSNGPA